ncbi:hypothetical protein [uncultured Shewanella sp.]|uniref:hypothetical protein n=1 Tax=uncultured Shewanella sp. TaxID=173975 RepID=UPI002614AEC0|nr:hypothetical protein [uncultured Shewanella sp.]
MTNIPVEKFFKLEGNSNNRIEIDKKDMSPQVSSKFTTSKGSFLLARQGTYQSENELSHIQFAGSMKNKYGDEGVIATKQLKGKQDNGNRLCKKDIKFAHQNIDEIKLNKEQFIKKQNQFINVGKDPRLAAIFDGESSITSKVKNKLSNKGLNKVIPKIDNIPVVKFGLNIGSMITDSNESHREHGVYNVLKRPDMENHLGKFIANKLDKNHMMTAEKTAIKTTSGIVAVGGVASGGVVSVGGLMVSHLVGHGIHKTIEGKLALKVGNMVQNKSEKTGISKVPSDNLNKKPDVTSLPRIEINDSKGYRYHELEKTDNIIKLLAYLGPCEEKDITQLEETFPGIKAGEKARLELKRELGSLPDENLIVGKKSSTPESDKILKKMMGSSSSRLANFLWEVKTGDYLVNPKYTVNSDEYKMASQVHKDFESTGGVPSALHLLLLAEGLIKV